MNQPNPSTAPSHRGGEQEILMFFPGNEGANSPVDLSRMSFNLEHGQEVPAAVRGVNPILAVQPPPDGKIRARKVVSRSRARGTGKFPSWKMGRMIQWESTYELK